MIYVAASYSFPAADNTVARFQDTTMGPTDLIRSKTGWRIDINPIFGPGLPNTMLRQDDGQIIYGEGGYGFQSGSNAYDDWPVIVNE